MCASAVISVWMWTSSGCADRKKLEELSASFPGFSTDTGRDNSRIAREKKAALCRRSDADSTSSHSTQNGELSSADSPSGRSARCKYKRVFMRASARRAVNSESASISRSITRARIGGDARCASREDLRRMSSMLNRRLRRGEGWTIRAREESLRPIDSPTCSISLEVFPAIF